MSRSLYRAFRIRLVLQLEVGRLVIHLVNDEGVRGWLTAELSHSEIKYNDINMGIQVNL